MERTYPAEEFCAEAGGRRRVYEFSLRQLVLNTALLLMSALLASYSPFEGVSPFGAACVMAAWFIGLNPYFACAGAAAGCLLSGGYLAAVPLLPMGVSIFVITRFKSPARVYRLLILFFVQTVSLLIAGAAAHRSAAVLAGSATVSVFAAVVIGNALRALELIPGGRSLCDTELLTLSALAGLITLSMRTVNIRGVSPAIVFAGACSLFAAYRYGMPSVAFALTAGAGRALAVGSDMRFIAVVSSMTLIGSAVRSLGKWAALAGFSLTGLALHLSVGGTGTPNIPELTAVSLIFALVPKRLYMPEGAADAGEAPRTDARFSQLQYRVASISEVLSELSRVYGSSAGRMLACIASALRRSLSGRRDPELFSAEIGTAAGAGSGSTKNGDSFTAAVIEGKLLLAISDGMGTGSAANEESRSALALLKDLLTVGFDIDEAVTCVNSLLASRGSGDMYATLDVMLIDLKDGIARLSKHGAPSSFILRNGRVFRLYSEGLPLGIIENAGGLWRNVRLKSGDAVIMMSDGVSDALGDELAGLIFDTLSCCRDAKKASAMLLDAARAKGGRDDMTVLTALLEEGAG